MEFIYRFCVFFLMVFVHRGTCCKLLLPFGVQEILGGKRAMRAVRTAFREDLSMIAVGERSLS